MTIEQKMEFLKRVIEMGADIQVSFHDIRKKEDAEKAAEELSAMVNQPFEYKSYKGADWLKIYGRDSRIETTLFYENEENKEEEVNV